MNRIIHFFRIRQNLLSILFICTGFLVATNTFAQVDLTLKVQYLFKNISADSSKVFADAGNDTATFQESATVKAMGNFNVLDLGGKNGYLDLGTRAGIKIAVLDSFTISTYIYIDTNTTISNNGNFIWTFANSNDVITTPNGQMFFCAKDTRYAISQTNWSGESGLSYAREFTKGSWKHVTYTQSGTTGKIYIDGVTVKTGTITKRPKILGPTSYNYIGRSPYASDAYLLNSMLYDFRIYNRALTNAEVAALDDSLANLNDALINYLLIKAKNTLTLGNIDEVVSNLTLSSESINNITIQWTSSNPSVISNTGVVTRPAIGSASATVSLTATLSKGGKSITKEFSVVVLPLFDDKNSVSRDAAEIVLSGNLNNLRSDLKLPVEGIEGSVITWESNKSDYLLNTGELVKLSVKGAGKEIVTLTATLTKGSESTTRNFVIYIAEDEGYDAYIFTYFTGTNEDLFFALSNDGFNFRALNGNTPIINSDTVSSTGGMRDPHILRGFDGNTYYMVATDMNVTVNGWSVPNYAMVLLKSTDLINWTSSVVNIPNTFAYFANAEQIWAPQTIYDIENGKYMVYWAMKKTSSDIFRIYYSYANSDFTLLDSVPKVLFASPTNSSCIDADILYREVDSTYNLFMKTEGGEAGIKRAYSKKLTGGYELYDKYLDRTTDAVEGSCTYRLFNTDTYILMYDLYTTGVYQITTSTDLINFYESNKMSMNFAPRHGTVMPITRAEAEALSKKWAKSTDIVVLSSNSKQVKTRNIVIDETNKTVYLPVKSETDLSSFNPELTSIPGAIITPEVSQDFTQGAVSYMVSIDGKGSKTYQVTAVINRNPVLDGYYADPEVLYSNKTKKYYIYPTSDGFTGWSGTYFKTFSSSDLVDWKEEGVILDLPTDVSWASTNAWAPTIIEKKIDGNYKYFFYFCAAQKIGVAVADDPIGPFYDSGKPLVSATPSGASGQQIDPDVFLDSISGKTYLFWGNGYMARAELNDDMISINTSTIKVITPDATFREGCEVFYRKGKYYFLWSENDTRSVDYRVRYATSNSPTGTFTIPANNLVIAKDADLGIYATGHNCVIRIPNTDKWYIIYHRFNRPNGITMGDAAGYNREICIDELKFDESGNIIQVSPTLIGIDPNIATTGVIFNQNTGSSVSLYPNPTTGQFSLKISNPSGTSTNLIIRDICGRVVYSKLINCEQYQTIDLSDKPSGIYFMQTPDGVQKIIKQ